MSAKIYNLIYAVFIYSFTKNLATVSTNSSPISYACISATLEGNSLRVKTPTYCEISPCKATHAYNPSISEPGTIRQTNPGQFQLHAELLNWLIN